MNFYTAKQIAEKWGLSVQLVRRYCKEGRIKSAIQYEGGWLIPEGTTKPRVDDFEEQEVPKLVKQLQYQYARNNHFGIYEYIQVNLAYSSCRMASNRLTRQQVEEIYRTKRITPAFEATKVDDIIEVMNHFICMRHVVDNIMMPLTQTFIKHLHQLLTYGTYADQTHRTGVGEYRTKDTKIGAPHYQINKAIADLVKDYEKKSVDLNQILDFHVRFEHIHPFDDYNGRVGRIIMMKECLRHEVLPFILDDNRRGAYNRGIANWETDPEILKSVVYETQKRFQNKLDVCHLMQYHRFPSLTHAK